MATPVYSKKKFQNPLLLITQTIDKTGDFL